jgi:cell division FtsZ-interacting protein ZapD
MEQERIKRELLEDFKRQKAKEKAVVRVPDVSDRPKEKSLDRVQKKKARELEL